MAKLYFRYGTMNSSKSAQLLIVNFNYTEQGKVAVIFKPLLDTRDGDFVKSRALNGKVPAVLIGVTTLGTMFHYAFNNKPDCVLVDEVQFMSESQIDELAKIVDVLGIPVIAYGLMTDFRTNLFPGSRRLIELGAKIEEIKSVCWYCSRKSIFNLRLTDGIPVFSGEQVQIGGNESYKAVCRQCYLKAKKG
jgi:thymidine kinase